MSRPRPSAGLLVYRKRDERVEVLLVHPGGPFWAKKDDGVWSIPKGEIEDGEDMLDAAQRELGEETGFAVGEPFRPLAPVRLKSGKVVHAWACEGDCDPRALRSNSIELEWPPRSGKMQSFPEVDRAAFFDLATARAKINPGQRPLLDELEALLG